VLQHHLQGATATWCLYLQIEAPGGSEKFVKMKFFRYRPGVAQTVGRGIGLLFHDCSARREGVVSSTPRPHFTPGKDTVPIEQEAGWVPGPVWTRGKSGPHQDLIPDRPARSQLLHRLSYSAHREVCIYSYLPFYVV